MNGHNVIIFSDTFVNGIGPLTNTIVYSAAGNPTSLQDFGGGGVPGQAIPYLANETAYNTAGNYQTRVAIWPTSTFFPFD